MSDYTVVKRNHAGVEVWRYTGTVLTRGATWVCLRAAFQRSALDAGYVVFGQGDIFTEWFYSDRYYNVFRLEDGDTGKLKGWYCNITRPANIGEHEVAADDLALDVFVRPDKTTLILDEDEFAMLPLDEAERDAALKAVATIQQLAAGGTPPFVP